MENAVENDEEDTARLVVAITDFLRDQLIIRTDMVPEDRDCLEIAIQCLEMAYGLEANRYLQFRFSRPLLDIFNQVTHPVSVRDKLRADAHKDEGNYYMRRSQFANAETEYTHAIELDRWNAIYYCNRASARIEQQNYFEAISDCRQALTLNPDYAKAHARMGQAYALLHRPRESARCYRQALELEPTNERYRNNLRVAESQIDRPDEMGLIAALINSIFGFGVRDPNDPGSSTSFPTTFMIITESHPPTRNDPSERDDLSESDPTAVTDQHDEIVVEGMVITSDSHQTSTEGHDIVYPLPYGIIDEGTEEKPIPQIDIPVVPGHDEGTVEEMDLDEVDEMDLDEVDEMYLDEMVEMYFDETPELGSYQWDHVSTLPKSETQENIEENGIQEKPSADIENEEVVTQLDASSNTDISVGEISGPVEETCKEEQIINAAKITVPREDGTSAQFDGEQVDKEVIRSQNIPSSSTVPREDDTSVQFDRERVDENVIRSQNIPSSSTEAPRLQLEHEANYTNLIGSSEAIDFVYDTDVRKDLPDESASCDAYDEDLILPAVNDIRIITTSKTEKSELEKSSGIGLNATNAAEHDEKGKRDKKSDKEKNCLTENEIDANSGERNEEGNVIGTGNSTNTQNINASEEGKRGKDVSDIQIITTNKTEESEPEKSSGSGLHTTDTAEPDEKGKRDKESDKGKKCLTENEIDPNSGESNEEGNVNGTMNSPNTQNFNTSEEGESGDKDLDESESLR